MVDDKKPAQLNPLAYALMQYQCENAQCSTLEIVWNTRNGKVPDGVVCRTCGKNQLHINPQLDMPQPGMRAVVDMSRLLADVTVRRYLAKMVDDGLAVPIMGTHEYDKLVDDLGKEWSQPGQPAMVHAGNAVEAAQVAWQALERWCATHPTCTKLNEALSEVRRLMTA